VSVADRVAAATGHGVRRASAVAGGDVCAAHRVELDDGRRVFVKSRPSAPPGFFTAEAAGLDFLRVAGGPAVPEVVAATDGPDAVLVLEWVDADHPVADDDELGRRLAALHTAPAPGFGFDRPGYLGPLPVDNEPAPDWPTFWRDRRLVPLTRRALDAGRIDATLARRLDRLADRLPELAGPTEPPARVHGDLWSGNVLADGDGRPWIVDPSAHGGHRETDLAMLRLFGGPGARCYRAYDDAAPLADGADERIALHQVVPLLVHVVLFGAGYRSGLESRLAALGG
jgi:fructosamine-3-kinase